MALEPLPLRIEPKLKENLQKLADLEGRSLSGIARDLLRQGVENRLAFVLKLHHERPGPLAQGSEK